ncbi:MAG: flavin reductase [Acholeplasmatales bacterium]|nr:flavin reductase [Acholeplasmatales bacterium]
MLKLNVEQFDKNVFKEIDKKWGIITAGDKTVGFNGMTVSWGGFGIMWNRPVAFIFVRKSRYTHEFLDKSNSITIAFLSDEYKEAKILFGRESGRDVNKYEKSGLHPVFEPDFNGYYPKESDYVFKMKSIYNVDLPTENMPDNIKNNFYPTNDIHTMYVCEIKEYLVKE